MTCSAGMLSTAATSYTCPETPKKVLYRSVHSTRDPSSPISQPTRQNPIRWSENSVARRSRHETLFLRNYVEFRPWLILPKRPVFPQLPIDTCGSQHIPPMQKLRIHSNCQVRQALGASVTVAIGAPPHTTNYVVPDDAGGLQRGAPRMTHKRGDEVM